MSLLKIPNLPKSRVIAAAISVNAKKLALELIKLGINPIYVQPNSALTRTVQSHPDMLIHHLGGDAVLLAKGQGSLFFRLSELGFNPKYIEADLNKAYPTDCLLNGARVGLNLICGNNIISTEIILYCENRGISSIFVKQGYSKCSVCVIDNQSIITADEGIHNAALMAGLDSLLISAGYVDIEDYDYGFLGGCCGKLDKSTLAFNGNIKNHPDYQRIKDFAKEKNVYLELLNSDPLFDIGGILPLCEQD